MWVSTNGGSSFSPFADILPTDSSGNPIYGPSQAIGAVAIDPVNSNPTTVYVATGEGNQSGDSYYGIGIFKSSDLGKTITWLLKPGQALSPSGTFGHPAFTRLAIDTSHNPPYLFAGAIRSGSSASRADAVWPESGPSDRGLFTSTNGGTTWTQTTSFPGASCNPSCDVDDVAVDPLSPSHVYVAIHRVGIYYSTNSGGTWTAVCSVSNPQCGLSVGRISLATEPPGSATSSAGTVYAMYGDTAGIAYSGFFSSTNFGVNWVQRTIPVRQLGTAPNCVVIDGPSNFATTCAGGQSSQSFYDQVIAVSPASPATVYFGGLGPYLSTDSGTTWTFLASMGGTHTDQHAAQFDSFNNTLLVGNDGGVYSYNLSARAWTGLNSTISAGQLQSIGPLALSSGLDNSQQAIAGFQDNGTQQPPTPGTNVPWSAVSSADGGGVLNGPVPYESGDAGFTMFAPGSSTYAYHVFPFAGVSASTNGGATWNQNAQSAALQSVMGGEVAGFYPPIAVDPVNPQVVTYGAHHTFTTSNAMTSWSAGPSDLTNPPTGATCAATDATCALQDLEIAGNATGPCPPGSLCGPLGYRTGEFTWSLSKKSAAVNPLIYYGFFGWTQTGVPSDANLTQPTGIFALGAPPAGSNTSASEKALLTLSGFKAGSSGTGISSHIYLTTNSGSTWTATDGSGGASPLPDVPVLAILADKTDASGNSLLAGTDAGLFSSTDGGATWHNFNTGVISHVPVFDIKQNEQGAIFVATHGRGAYRLSPVARFAGDTEIPDTEQMSCSPYTTTITVDPPTGVKNGDVLIMPIEAGMETAGSVPTLPSGWSLVGFSNQNGALTINSTENQCGFFATTSLAMHVYSSTDTTPYSFSASITPLPDTCHPGFCFFGELGAILLSYRGADTKTGDYTAYAYPNSLATFSTTGAVTVGKFVNLLNVFTGENEQDDTNSCEQFSVITGSPTLVDETGPTPSCDALPFMAADVWSGASGGTFGPYSTTPANPPACTSPPCPAALPALQVVIPPQP